MFGHLSQPIPKPRHGFAATDEFIARSARELTRHSPAKTANALVHPNGPAKPSPFDCSANLVGGRRWILHHCNAHQRIVVFEISLQSAEILRAWSREEDDYPHAATRDDISRSVHRCHFVDVRGTRSP